MYSQFKAQDVIRCDICENDAPHMHCDICHINLCKACVMDHLSDESKNHKLVSFHQRGSTINYPRCQIHTSKICELHCEQCTFPICASCVSSGDHDQHQKVDFLEHLRDKKDIIEKHLKELKTWIYPKLLKTTSNLQVQRSDVSKHSTEMNAALNKQAEALHIEIDSILKDMQCKIKVMDSKHLSAIDQQEKQINQSIYKITQVIRDLQNLLDSNDASLITAYTSRIEEFKNFPSQFHVIIPTFIPQEIKREQIYQQFGILSKLFVTYPTRPIVDNEAITNGDCNGLEKNPGVVSTPFAYKFQIVTDLNTKFGGWFNRLHSVSCLTDEEIWTTDSGKHRKLFNLQGKLKKLVKTKSGNKASDIEVTRDGNLVYTDYKDNTINLVTDGQIQPLVKLEGWKPYGLCRSTFDDLLVIMDNNDGKETKVVRYSGFKGKQCIQWDDLGQPLYSSALFNCKYLCENRNLDICVADGFNGAIVVVNAIGELRFRYTGPPCLIKERFHPRGITTDIQGRILTTDSNSNLVHIVDLDGQFLCYIDNCDLHPWGICVDSKNNIFVGEFKTGKVKKIERYKQKLP